MATYESKENIIKAAIKCFEKVGAKRSSMAVIAEEAGISRKTLYRTFADRSDLIKSVLNRRIFELGKITRKNISNYSDIEKALIEGSLLSVAVARKDKLLNGIVTEEIGLRIDQLLMQANSSFHKDMVEIWSPVINKGRENGLVRPDLSNERIVELLTDIHAFLTLKDNYGEAEQRAFLVDFLVPAVLLRSHEQESGVTNSREIAPITVDSC